MLENSNQSRLERLTHQYWQIVSFGYTGSEPFFFADCACVDALCGISTHRVSQELFPRPLGYGIFRDIPAMSLFPVDVYGVRGIRDRRLWK